MFYVGQKVVCVNPKPNLDWRIEWLEKGRVYTVASVSMTRDSCGMFTGELVSVNLIELPKKVTGFAAERFRPVVERKTDISIFTAMLNPSRVEVPA